MKNASFSYDVTVSQTGLMSIKMPSHLLAVLVAEKLKLPMPARNAQCEVTAAETPSVKEEDHMVNIDFEYLTSVNTAPVTLTLPAEVEEVTEGELTEG